MIKIAHVHQLASIKSLPVKMMPVDVHALIILDNEYSDNRDVDSGFV